ATDASVYRKLPLAVAFPRSKQDLQKLMRLAHAQSTSLTFRAAGTSLAGQCVTNGIVVDMSRYFTNILDIDPEDQIVKVEPGVIRDELNQDLERYNLFFGPNTSTSNRCMLGGMIGNNSSGTTSIKYGVTRDKVVDLECLLSDGTEVVFGELTIDAFHQKLKLDSSEGEIYRKLYALLKDENLQKEIHANFPKKDIHRRNTGYALDHLIGSSVFDQNSNQLINVGQLIAGSEGSLAVITAATLKLDPLPPKHKLMIAAHFENITDCLNAVKPLMQADLYTCEMMDKQILDCTKGSLKYAPYRFFIQNDPQAILLLELNAASQANLLQQKDRLIEMLASQTKSYANSLLEAENIHKALELRKAGLGLLGSLNTGKKAVACIEDTAVSLNDFADYMRDFEELMQSFNQSAIYYAHAGAGELHLRPLLNLKDAKDVSDFKQISKSVALLVKKYQGSLSGEHGDGIVRSSFIEMQIGEICYQALSEVKNIFDPRYIFNPGKIVNPNPMDESLRYQPDKEAPQIQTLLNFSKEKGLLSAAENCNGSGDCRKSEKSNGTMCPSYQATKNEKDSTRGRANILREYLTNSTQQNPFDHKELKEVFELCISCKACRKECPSNVDVASYKAEFLYQYHRSHSRHISDYVFGFNHEINRLGSYFSSFFNFSLTNPTLKNLLSFIFKIHKERELPLLSQRSLQAELKSKNRTQIKSEKAQACVYLFVDEFTNYTDVQVGIDCVDLLSALNYKVKVINNKASGRALLSKGFLKQAKKLANKNIELYKDLISEDVPLIGLEPSAILSFRDDYLRLADDQKVAQKLAQNSFLVEEFLANEMKAGVITPSQFTAHAKHIKIHAHCHQKALSQSKYTFDMLNCPQNYKVSVLSSGCCGMAGSFGYEEKNYDISMKIGELQLFPHLRNLEEDVVIAANGTSCRHQIKDAIQINAQHPVSLLKEALV
ncbi:MAG: FAD-binding protein, partial [Psychroflexus sp.]|nr:FAD-binding protein [Psychroflexus sp.]